MHDVTEGGLATALRELAAATGRGVLVHRDRVPVSPETRRLCDLLGADPLGLIASGSLLVCCDPAEAADLLAALAAAGIPAADIGELTGEGAGVAALERGRPAPWPEFATDEAARLLAGRAEDGRRLTPRPAGRGAPRAPARGPQRAVSCQSMFISSQSSPSASRSSATGVRRRHRDDELHLEQRRVGVRAPAAATSRRSRC